MGIVNNIRRIISVNWLLSLFINIYYLGIRRFFYFPILVGYGVKIGKLGDKGSITVPNKFASFCFALKGNPFDLGNSSYWYIGNRSQLSIQGSCRMAKGVRMKIFDGAKLIVGNHFTSNANMIISCLDHIQFGEECLLGWDITIMDNDGGHSIIDLNSSNSQVKKEPVFIGNHVWIGSRTSILKGASISEGSIIGYNSILCGLKVEQPNSLIVGIPAKIKKTGVSWSL